MRNIVLQFDKLDDQSCDITYNIMSNHCTKNVQNTSDWMFDVPVIREGRSSDLCFFNGGSSGSLSSVGGSESVEGNSENSVTMVTTIILTWMLSNKFAVIVHVCVCIHKQV